MTRGLATAEVSFRDEIERLLNDEIPSLEQSQADLIEEAKEEYGSYSETPREYEQTYERLEEKRTTARGKANALARFIAGVCYGVELDELDDPPTDAEDVLALDTVPEDADAVFTIQELTGGELAMVEDDVAHESFDVDPQEGDVEGTPKSGYGRVLSCKQAITDWPEECPTDDRGRCDVAVFSHQVQDFLFERVNNLNAVGDTDLGNSSLRQAMARDSDDS